MNNFWKHKRVFVTGHTGFKGSWLCMILTKLGAEVYGYSLEPSTVPSLFKLGAVEKLVKMSSIGDIRDPQMLNAAMKQADPDIVIHMAAQPLVRDSYENPYDTYSINVMGTVNMFEAVRKNDNVRAVVNVTTDKCYENKEWLWGYREDEPMGGYDPYSSSKACSELVTSAYRNSFFNNNKSGKVAVASARAGNVIGGGDWAKDRLIPDCINSLLNEKSIVIRNPHSIRPWQHVLEPLHGYLLLAQNLYENGEKFATAWNFGPYDTDAKPVNWIVESLCQKWGNFASYKVDQNQNPHEARYLKLDCSKAHYELGWRPKWNLNQALDKIIEWSYAYQQEKDIQEICFKQIEDYNAE
ncbi:CDP-glucose 4,6-dehydratase [Paenibacillus sp. Soil750]|uniref:CDP-glucose 4,6-dehydratase n=1 Tax=Paenibacillus sp. Soil750 TaxID=1736398 RepID=UPI0006F1EC25|nr:CDP-glucose 4,6-dehydratase [Paenibacillus sp. Soil750]KRE75413.1 CDP-glucose 4,6-dehydratase [Paenibacillus sp. Soil750]